jgi:DNA-directed RNA polymerase subunit M/transcription elongation factor TFIIS
VLFQSTRSVIAEGRRQRMLNDKKVFDLENADSKSDFECPKCKSFNTRAVHRQVRGADESMTIFWHCKSCGKHGTIN